MYLNVYISTSCSTAAHDNTTFSQSRLCAFTILLFNDMLNNVMFLKVLPSVSIELVNVSQFSTFLGLHCTAPVRQGDKQLNSKTLKFNCHFGLCFTTTLPKSFVDSTSTYKVVHCWENRRANSACSGAPGYKSILRMHVRESSKRWVACSKGCFRLYM